MKNIVPIIAFAGLPVLAQSQESTAWQRFNDWSIADIFYPNLHIHGVSGMSTAEPKELSDGGHDPQREDFVMQAIEPGVSVRTQYFEGFSNYLFYQDADGHWDGEFEEAFGKIMNIPGGFELKGGQFFSRFGTLNNRHLHGWDFVDSEMSITRFLGNDGLILQGAELSWTLPFRMEPSFVSIASLGFGNARTHDHGHAHEHENEEPPHEGDDSTLTDDILTARLIGRYRFDDFHSIIAGASWAGGTNGYGRDAKVIGLDMEYLWRENGLEIGGRAFRWRNELFWRDVDAFSEHDEDDDGIIDETYIGSFDESGLYSHVIYTWMTQFDTGLRLGWVEGIDDFGQDERFRVSPALSWWFDQTRRVGMRLQYNFDSIASHDDEHSIWLQLNIGLGDQNEVR